MEKSMKSINESYVFNVVSKCLENIGLIIDITNLDLSDVDLTEYGMDSLAFISFIIDVEQQLDIIIPEEILQYDILQSLNGFVNLLTQVYDDQKSMPNS